MFYLGTQKNEMSIDFQIIIDGLRIGIESALEQIGPFLNTAIDGIISFALNNPIPDALLFIGFMVMVVKLIRLIIRRYVFND